MDNQDFSSSLDPLSIMPNSSPARSPRRSSKGPLAARSFNATSPSKSMILDTGDVNGKSPWRIKVTVEAEPNDDSQPHINRRPRRNTRTTTVPTKDDDGPSPVKRKSRPFRTNAATPGKELSDFRKPTPPRRKLTPGRKTQSVSDNEDDINETVHSPLIDLHTGQISGDYSIDEHTPANHDPRDDPIDYSLSIIEPDFEATVECNDPSSKDRDEDMWRAMAEKSTMNAQAEDVHHEDQANYSLSEDEDYEEEPIQAPGDATVLESEEFSMISVDSLSSHQNGRSPVGAHEPSVVAATIPPSSALKRINISYMPSSPPSMSHDRLTPVIDEPSPVQPPAPLNSLVKFPHIMTPLRESAVRSGRVLQDIVRSPERESLASKNDGVDRSIFGGFSTGTRRQLRQSLHMGANLEDTRSPLDNKSKYLAPADMRPHHRLPTPDDNDHSHVTKTSSTDASAGIVYPILQGVTVPVISPTKTPEYDAMSWVATGRPRLASPMPLGEESTHEQPLSSAQRSLAAAPDAATTQHTIELSSDDSSELPEEPAEEEGVAADDRDIWQEEASRSIIVDDEPHQLLDIPVKPPRSKLPGTWRRISGANFHYSDSPEPEFEERRKISSGSSGNDSGIATPPTSDGHDLENEDEEEEEEDNDFGSQDGEPSHMSDEDVHTPASDGGASQDGDDTGLFWQSNMPNVFMNRRPALVRDKTEYSVLSELKLPSSPVKQGDKSILISSKTSLDVHTVEGRPSKTNRSSSALDTPLRKSLLKSSKIRSSPLAKDSSVSTDNTNDDDLSDMSDDTGAVMEETNRAQESSMASDTRQILNEMATARRRASQALDDMNQVRLSISENLASSRLDFSETDLSRSYVEHLNHDSPAKITVNFNDSTVISSSMLAPKKSYPPLFDAAPVLAPTTTQPPSPPKPASLMSALTTSFWSSVVPSSPANAPPPLQPTSPTKLSRETTTIPHTNVADHILRLRRKYGLLPSTHPFTMSHIRTLHRLLNSARQHLTSSIIPLSTPLDASLAPFLGKEIHLSLPGQRWEEAQLKIVQAFTNLLVEPKEIKRLESLGRWGDGNALKARGFDSRGRHGSYLAFSIEGGGKEERDARAAGQLKGEIRADWVVGVLAEILVKEQRGR